MKELSKSSSASLSLAHLNAILGKLTYGDVAGALSKEDCYAIGAGNDLFRNENPPIDVSGTLIPVPPIASGPFFLLPYCPEDNACQMKRHKILQSLREFPKLNCLELRPWDLFPDGCPDFPPTFRVCVFSVRTKQIERVKDALKNALYPDCASYVLDQVSPLDTQLHLRAYGLFLSPKPLPASDIIVHGFEHAGSMFYRYRLSRSRARLLPSGLHDYLLGCLEDCPNRFFFSPPRCSSLCRCFDLRIPAMHRDDAGGIMAAIRELPRKRAVRSGHEHLQKYLMDTDSGTVACEVPLYLFGWEIYENSSPLPVHASDILTGHIDVLRHHDGKVWVWDYKPHARCETTAAQQVYLYSLMISQRGSLPLEEIRCGYFDERDVFWFEPREAKPAIF